MTTILHDPYTSGYCRILTAQEKVPLGLSRSPHMSRGFDSGDTLFDHVPPFRLMQRSRNQSMDSSYRCRPEPAGRQLVVQPVKVVSSKSVMWRCGEFRKVL